MDIVDYNRKAWNRYSEQQSNNWVRAVGAEEIEKAKNGMVEISLTAAKTVPSFWFPELNGCRILCLASGGGQQAPILAAAGADVTAFDNSDKQLESDKKTCEAYGLQVKTVQGDMRDLSAFVDESFDLIFHPVSNLFVDKIENVWKESARVLRSGGLLLAGFSNPVVYMFDALKCEKGILEVKHSIPYSPFSESAKEESARFIKDGDALEYGHSLEEQIGGQLDAGFAIVAMYEDHNRAGDEMALDEYMPVYIATKAVKL